MICQTCGEEFDPASLDEVMFHCTDHKPRPDIQYSGSKLMTPDEKDLREKAAIEDKNLTSVGGLAEEAERDRIDKVFIRLGHKPEDRTCDHSAYAQLKEPRPRHCPTCGTCMWDAGD